MDDGQDVNQTDATTVTPSSEGQQTAPEATNTNVPDGDLKTIPYDRFKEVNDELREIKSMVSKQGQVSERVNLPPQDPQLQAQIAQAQQVLKPMLDQMGYVSRDEIQRQEQDRQLKQEIATMEGKYDGKDGKPKFDRQAVMQYAQQSGIFNLDAAYTQMHQADIINWHIQQAVGKSQGIKTEASNGSGSQNAGITDADIATRIAKGDTSAVRLQLQRIAKDKLGKT